MNLRSTGLSQTWSVNHKSCEKFSAWPILSDVETTEYVRKGEVQYNSEYARLVTRRDPPHHYKECEHVELRAAASECLRMPDITQRHRHRKLSKRRHPKHFSYYQHVGVAKFWAKR